MALPPGPPVPAMGATPPPAPSAAAAPAPQPPEAGPPQPGDDDLGLPDAVMKAASGPTWEDVVAVLRSDKLRSFKISIETDSTVAADQEAEQQGRTALVTAIGGFLEKSIPFGQQFPQLAPLIGEMIMFVIRAWKVGRPLEQAFEDAMKQLQEAAEAAKDAPPKPDPAMIEAQAKAGLITAQTEKTKAEVAALGGEAQAKQAEAATKQAEAQAAGMKAQGEAAAAIAKINAESVAQIAEIEAQRQTDLTKIDRENATKVRVAEIGAIATVEAAEISATAKAASSPDGGSPAAGGSKIVGTRGQAAKINEGLNALMDGISRLTEMHAQTLAGQQAATEAAAQAQPKQRVFEHIRGPDKRIVRSVLTEH